MDNYTISNNFLESNEEININKYFNNQSTDDQSNNNEN